MSVEETIDGRYRPKSATVFQARMYSFTCPYCHSHTQVLEAEYEIEEGEKIYCDKCNHYFVASEVLSE